MKKNQFLTAILWCLLKFIYSKDSLINVLKGGVVWAFGDSLTHGLYVEPVTNEWKKTHPYTIKLSQLLQQHGNITVKESGKNGESTYHMIGRLQEMLHDNRHKNPSLIIILGGTNDLGTLPSDSIYENIQKIHLLALKSSLLTERPIYTIAVTIPQLTWGGENSNLKRLNVNENIRKLVKRCNKYIFLFDMESLFDQKNEAYKIYWSPDQVHFSPLGYDKIGELLYDLITSVKIPDDSVDLKETIKTCHLTEVS